MTNTDAELIADPDVQRLWDAAPLMPKLKGLIRDTRLTLNGLGFALAATQEEAIMDATAQAIVNMVQKHLTAEGATGVPEGWKLVPVKATARMIAYGEGYADFVLPSGFENTQESRRREMAMAYGVMVEAAPNPPVRPEQSASEPGRSSTTPTEGPAPVEAPHSVEEDESTVRRFIGGTTIVWDTPPTSRAEALAALGRLADGARR